MEKVYGASADADRALAVPAEPASSLDPSGFDPSRSADWYKGFDAGVDLAGAAQANLIQLADRERKARSRAEEAFDLLAPWVAKFADASPFYDGGRPRYLGSQLTHDPDPGHHPALKATMTGVGGPGAPLSPTLADLRMLAAVFTEAVKIREAHDSEGGGA